MDSQRLSCKNMHLFLTHCLCLHFMQEWHMRTKTHVTSLVRHKFSNYKATSQEKNKSLWQNHPKDNQYKVE